VQRYSIDRPESKNGTGRSPSIPGVRNSALGANFRRLIGRIKSPKAITAMARKLAALIYRMLKYGTQDVDKGMEHYEAKYRETRLQYLRCQAAKLGMNLVPN
jgi:transposase